MNNSNIKKYNIVIVGSTGAVGKEMIKILEERNFPIENLTLLASKNSVGIEVLFNAKSLTTQKLTKNSFKNIDYALFSAGGNISKEFAPIAVKAGAIVIDNSSYFRIDERVPLVIPEINPEDISLHKGIVASPNCTTIILLLSLKPIHNYSKITRVLVSTYQSVSGAGAKGVYDLAEQQHVWKKDDLDIEKSEKELRCNIFNYSLLNNLVPQVDDFTENGYTKEEMKMYNETIKIMKDENIKVSSTCVRVPVFFAHSESVTVETEDKISVEKIKELLRNADGIELYDDISEKKYPMPVLATGKDNCFIGRIRKDISNDNSISFWICGDQLRKGAALNAIQIMEKIIANK